MAKAPEMKAFYEGWADQQAKLVETIRPLTPEQMQLRVGNEWAIWQLASNMAGGRMYWLCFVLGEDDLGVGKLFSEGGWEDTPDRPRTAPELIDAFEKTWRVAEACTGKWTLADLNVEVQRKNFWGQTITVSPAWVLWRLMSHEMHHGSEISMILRVHGLPTTMNL